MGEANQENCAVVVSMHGATCLECGSDFTRHKSWQKFCTGICRDRHHLRKRKNPPGRQPTASLGGNIEKIHASNYTAYEAKWKRVLAQMAQGRALDRFTSAHELQDSALNTTISYIESRGVEVSRRSVPLTGLDGCPVYGKVYWLDSGNKKRAAVLLGWQTCQGR